MTAAQFSHYVDERPTNIKRRIITTGWGAFGFGTSILTVPGGLLWRPISLSFTLTTSATAGSRFPFLTYNLEGGKSFAMQSGATIPPSISASFTYWIQYGSATNANNAFSVPMPDVILTGGEQIFVQVSGTQTGDTVTNQAMWVDELFQQKGAPPPDAVTVVDRLDSIEESIHRLR